MFGFWCQCMDRWWWIIRKIKESDITIESECKGVHRRCVQTTVLGLQWLENKAERDAKAEWVCGRVAEGQAGVGETGRTGNRWCVIVSPGQQRPEWEADDHFVSHSLSCEQQAETARTFLFPLQQHRFWRQQCCAWIDLCTRFRKVKQVFFLCGRFD